MSEMRFDPLLGNWVIIASAREKRPHDVWLSEQQTTAGRDCPFCPGREDHTTPEVLAIGRDLAANADSTGWQVRVVPNKYPAVCRETVTGESEQLPVEMVSRDLYRSLPGIGAHEVVIHSPDHNGVLAALGPRQLAALFAVYQQRLLAWYDDPCVRYTAIICNQGAAAGATQPHPHSQVITTPIMPPAIANRMQRARDHHRRTGRCLFCELVAAETKSAQRIVAQNEHFLVFTPYASRFPFELMILPRQHQSRLNDVPANELAALAEVVDSGTRAIADALADPPLNLALFSAPRDELEDTSPDAEAHLDAYYHWHLELTPRLTRVAGFETSTGLFINSTVPEEAARKLRQTRTIQPTQAE